MIIITIKIIKMETVTYTDEELAEYLLENTICTQKELNEQGVTAFAFFNGFSWDSDIERWIPL